ncbi:MAG TPA: hypothetical protein VJM34_16910 [Novosphingobium sp.]|nr:hypothetical protein [Novosphingobium sp.]
MRFRDIIFTASGAIAPLLICPALQAEPAQDQAGHKAKPAFHPLTIVQRGSEFIIADISDRQPPLTNTINIGSSVTFDDDLVRRAGTLPMGEQHASAQ